MDNVSSVLDLALHVMERTLRSTGRTTRMLASLEGGELVICPSEPSMEHQRRMFAEMHRGRPPLVAFNVVKVSDLDEASDRLYMLINMTQAHRVVFTHEWVERHYHLITSKLEPRFNNFASHLNDVAAKYRS